jgi:DNA-binding NarL/FixJ family response regulator
MIRVLLVEDDAEFRSNLGQWLARAGFAVSEAADGGEALARLREAPCDVVVTDLCMPRCSGIELLDALEGERFSGEVVFLTGQGSLETAIAALRGGRAFDYMLKPLRDLSGFRATLERAAARARIRADEARRQGDTGPALLPERDHEILLLVGQGLDNREIGARLGISERTVRNRLSMLYERLGVANRTQAVLWGQARGLL